MTDTANLNFQVNSQGIASATYDMNSMAAAAQNVSVQLGQTRMAAEQLGTAFTGANQRIQGSIRETSQRLQFLTFQLNDIAVSLASGQSPFTVIMQQGAQIAQLFQRGTTGIQALRVVWTEAMSFLTNPLTLWVAGLAAAAGAATFLFRSISDGSKEAEEHLKAQVELVKDLESAYKSAATGIRDYRNESLQVLNIQRTVLREQLTQDMARMSAGAMTETRGAQDILGRLGGAPSVTRRTLGVQLTQQEAGPFLEVLSKFHASALEGRGDALALGQAISSMIGPDTPEKWRKLGVEILKRSEELRDVQRRMESLDQAFFHVEDWAEGMRRSGSAASDLEKAIRGVNSAVNEPGFFDAISIFVAPSNEGTRRRVPGTSDSTINQRAKDREFWDNIPMFVAPYNEGARRGSGQGASDSIINQRAKDLEQLRKDQEQQNEDRIKREVKEAEDRAKELERIERERQRQLEKLRQDEIRQEISDLDDMRSMTRGFLGDLAQGLIAGKSAADAFRAALANLGAKMLDMGLDMITSSMFGKMGSPLGGLIGNLFNANTPTISGGAGTNTYSSSIGSDILGSALPGVAADVISGGASSDVLRGGIQVGGIENYIRSAFAKAGINPDLAVKVARQEGLGTSWQSTARQPGTGIREPSYGEFQFLKGGPGTGFPGGVGNDFMRDTGLDPADPANRFQMIDYAAQRVRNRGWGEWMGAEKIGVTGKMGVGGAPDQVQQAADQLQESSKQMVDATKTSADMLQKGMPQAANQVVTAVSSVAQQIAGAQGGVGSIIPSLLSVFQGGGMIGGGGFAPVSGGLYGGGRASGGGVQGGRSYIVGERGPEMVHMGDDGYVSSASDTERIMSGSRGRSGSSRYRGGDIHLTVQGSLDERIMPMVERRLSDALKQSEQRMFKNVGNVNKKYGLLRAGV